MLGELRVGETFKIATKVYPSQLGDHKPEKLKDTFRTSLAALQQKKVDLFYLHAPVSVEESLTRKWAFDVNQP